MSESPRVLHVVESWRPVVSGYTSRSWHIVERQAALGIARPKVLVSSRQHTYGQSTVDPIPCETAKQGMKVEVMACEPSAREKSVRKVRPFDLDRKALTQRIIEAGQDCEIIHVHWSSGIGMATADAASHLGLPLVAEVRFDLAGAMVSQTFAGRTPMLERPLRRWFERHLQHATQVVGASHCLGDLLTRELPQTRDKLTVILNGVKPPSGHKNSGEAVRDRFDITGQTVIGSTSKMLRYENLEAIVQAVRQLDGAHALLVGDGPQRPALERKARQWNAPVTFTGLVPPNELPGYLGAMDIFAVPRREVTVTRYAAPLKVVEAMAAGRAIIGTRVGDIPLLLGDDRGVVIEPGDRQAFIQAIEAFANDPARRATLGQRAADWANAHLRWDDTVGRYEAVYRKALA